MKLLRLDRRAAAGALIGVAGSATSVLLSGLAGESEPYIVLLLLTVALVGLGLGGRASFYAYITSSVVLVAVGSSALATSSTSAMSQFVRFGAFIVGSPLVVLLALRAERERQAVVEARDASAASERRLAQERQAAEEARRQADVALQHADRDRARLAEVAEAIPEPLIVYGADGVGSYANRAALRIFGRSFVERPLDEWGRTTEPRDEQGAPLDEEEYPQLAAQRSTLRRRMTVRLPMSGRDLLIDVEGTPIPGGGAVLLLRDVGKEEDERQRLSRFASFVAHELRNPLAVARARIELTERESGLPDRAAAHGVRALESVEAAIAILERLEMYSRADTGILEAELEPFDPRAAIAAAVERLRARGSDREVRVQASGRGRALGDRRLAEQAITNLLTNADRYSHPNRPITVSIDGGDQVVVRVGDEGPGIADNVADRLFVDRMAAGRGLGLGLYLVRAMMAAQGGSVQLEQRRPSAIFALRWPRATDRSRRRSAGAPAEPAAMR